MAARDRLPLVSWLIATALEGLVAGLSAGVALLLLQSDIQALIAGQPSPLFAAGIFLLQCCQIGVVVSVSLTLMTDWSS